MLEGYLVGFFKDLGVEFLWISFRGLNFVSSLSFVISRRSFKLH